MSLCGNAYASKTLEGVPVCEQTQRIPGCECVAEGEGCHEPLAPVPVPLATLSLAYVA